MRLTGKYGITKRTAIIRQIRVVVEGFITQNFRALRSVHAVQIVERL